MFDDDQGAAKLTPPPANLPSEPADMFAEFDVKSSPPTVPVNPNALQVGLLKPKKTDSDLVPPAAPRSAGAAPAPTVTPDPATSFPTMYTVKEPILGKIILIVATGALLLGIAYGAYWFYAKSKNVIPPADIAPGSDTATESSVGLETMPVSPISESIASSTTDNSEINQQQKNDQILFGEPIDSDQDGLDDGREVQLGTNQNNSDTDGDALSDGDEVLIWKTDPLNPDSDGDRYLDGEEVAHGYNPLGPGKLNLIAPAVSATSSENN